MNAQIEISAMGIHSSTSPMLQPAPSLRVPVTPGNRSWLRRLRAAELAAWEAGRTCTRIPIPLPQTAVATQLF